MIGSLAFFAGPAIGAAVVAVSNAGAAFFINALTFAVSVVLISRIGDVGGAGGVAGGTAEATVVADMAGGAGEIRDLMTPGSAGLCGDSWPTCGAGP